MFHHFHGINHPPDRQGSISADRFYSILKSIGTSRFISPTEWISRLSKGELKDSDLCITFDDGLLSQYEVCKPVLDSLNLKAFWFIYTSQYHNSFPRLDIYRRFRTLYFDSISHFLSCLICKLNIDEELIFGNSDYSNHFNCISKLFPFYSDDDIKFRYIRDFFLSKEDLNYILDSMIEDEGLKLEEIASNLWLSEEQVRSLSLSGHCIGLHSSTHPIPLESLPIETQREEYIANYRDIHELSKAIPLSMAHPADSYNYNTLSLLSELGIVCGFRSNTSKPKVENSFIDLQIPRVDVTNLDF